MGLIKNKGWQDYLWIASAIYLVLGFVNILFAWLGIICFTVPLAISLIKGIRHIAIIIVEEDSFSAC